MSLGEKLTNLRKEKGMSQEDLANSLNVSRQAVSKWESNNSYPETEKIVAICKLFNCSMDELIGLKEGIIKKENNIFNRINKYFDMFIKGIKLFYSMTFKQKVKCLIEMGFYTLVIFIILLILNNLLVEIFRNLFYLVPDEILYVLMQTFRGILYLISLLIGLYILVKLYRIRYLDYYEEYDTNKKKNIDIEKFEDIKKDKQLSIKEEKIIIRDPENDFKPFNLFKNLCIYFVKVIALIISFGLAIAFVILIAISIFALSFIKYGMLIIYIVIGLLGSILSLYILLEVLIKFIFNMNQHPKRLFIMFIIAMFIVGISGGLFTSEVSSYSIIDEIKYSNKVFEESIPMEDNLIIDFLSDNTEVIFEDREDILIEVYGLKSEILTTKLHSFESNESYYCSNNVLKTNYHIYSYYMDYSFNNKSINEIIKEILKTIKHKQIIVDDILYSSVSKIYISEKNYQVLLENYDDYYNKEDICE